uniref:Uncharacterized protein LOC104223319 n=1 Tax=Nicotiana sylvestris TaxID=4096 RepID=A0A1U7WFN1_NICSY|nr:PREDICTED: uncharacterized protein LOC104223319 [Nicotiana sylvestris]
MQQDEDLEPKAVDECRQRNDWPKWKNAIQTELASLEKCEVFGPIVRTPEGVKLVGYKWVFVRKRNEKGEVQSGRIWYNRLSEYLLNEGYKNDTICPCVFIKRSGSEFVIIVVYVDDLNIIGTSKELPKAVECYLSDPHKARSQTGYLFTYGGIVISWRSMKQTIVATSSNHGEIIAIHEASRECVWLRSMTQHIQEMCGFLMKTDNPTTLYEDNVACIAQLKGGYIKGDRTKHISPKFFFTHDLQQNGEINVQQIRSCENLVDLFTKALPTSTFEKLRQKIGMRRLREIK